MIAEAMPGVLIDVMAGVLAIRNRASHRCDDGSRHAFDDIEPEGC